MASVNVLLLHAHPLRNRDSLCVETKSCSLGMQRYEMPSTDAVKEENKCKEEDYK